MPPREKKKGISEKKKDIVKLLIRTLSGYIDLASLSTAVCV